MLQLARGNYDFTPTVSCNERLSS
eukprot:SAG11_NODE_29794_length_307_cov_0.750000_1_plen_23_part_01